MELRVLRYFLTLAREENITKAAEALFITQPTLSRQLAELEAELGTKLFERGKRRITLTEEGMLLRRRAEEMIELEDKVAREFRQQSENLGGVISIGAAETTASALLPRAVSEFHEQYPAVTFSVETGTADVMKERLDRGLLDLGLLVEPGDIDKYDFLRLPYADRCGILMSAASPLAAKDAVTVEDLLGLPVLSNIRPSVQRFYRNALGEAYDRLHVVATFDLIGNAAHFALQDRGYVFTIEGSVSNYNNPGLCFRPFSPEIHQTTCLIWKKYQPMSRAVRTFIDFFSMLFEHDVT